MNNTITLSELSSLLDKQEGKQILITTGSLGFTFKTFSTVQNVKMYTWGFKMELENNSTIELEEDNIEKINYNNELSSNNTQYVRIKLKNDSAIKIEFEVK